LNKELLEIEKHLVKGNISDAINLLVEFSKNNHSEYFSELSTLKNQYYHLEREKRLGLNNNIEEFNRIINSLTSVIIELKKKKPTITAEFSKNTRPNFERILLVFFLCVYLPATIIYTISTNKEKIIMLEDFKNSLDEQVGFEKRITKLIGSSYDRLDSLFVQEVHKNEVLEVKDKMPFLDCTDNDSKIVVKRAKKICVQNIKIFRYFNEPQESIKKKKTLSKEKFFIELRDSLNIIDKFPNTLFFPNDSTLNFIKQDVLELTELDFFKDDLTPHNIFLNQVAEIRKGLVYYFTFSVIPMQIKSSDFNRVRKKVFLIFEIKFTLKGKPTLFT